jgi:hypothetical protein
MGLSSHTPPPKQQKLYITRRNYMDLNNKRNYVPIQPVYIDNNTRNETKIVRRIRNNVHQENNTLYYAKKQNLNNARKQFLKIQKT